MKNMLMIFIGGGLGANLRYLLFLTSRSLGAKLWMGTLAANMIGCLFFFLVAKNFALFKDYDVFLRVGLLGGLTTFSTFSYEVVMSFKTGRTEEAILILFLNIFFGILIGIGVLR